MRGWDYLSEPVKKLMARNGFQVLGLHLNKPIGFLICWTPEGVETKEDRKTSTGGTGQAISIASSKKIRVYNLANKKSYIALKLRIRHMEIR